MPSTNSSFLNRPGYQHLLFWGLVYACYIISNWTDYESPTGVFVTYTFRVVLQIGLAYLCLLWVIPRYLEQKRWVPAAVVLLFAVILCHLLHTAGIYFILEPTFPKAYVNCRSVYAGLGFQEQLLDFNYAFFITPALFFPPTFVLVAIQYFQKQRQLSELNEQKRAAELSALKNQLNPHFLFNTLNNLYTLALKKSDQTATAISKLSDILDYILYRCNERFVAITPEIELIKSYVALEKLRYGKRVRVNLNTSLEHPQQIAPLLLLTFIENAFKHGVSQEINQAEIDIALQTQPDGIDFSISNTIPSTSPTTQPDRNAIGLENIRRQLDLVYPGKHQLHIHRTQQRYSLNLQLQTT
ncbi:MAG: histidine kinase [Bacteroidota bacterium]